VSSSEYGTDDLLAIFVHLFVEVEAELAQFVLSGWCSGVAGEQALGDQEEDRNEPQVE